MVIAHGFAGSQQLMQPAAIALARNGYRAVTFDFPGHGRNPAPLRGGLEDDAVASGVLLDSLDRVVALARRLPGGDGRLALLGHSMAADIVVRYALLHPGVSATVALSLFGPPGITAAAPANLLVVVGAWEPALLRDEGLRVAELAAGAAAAPGITYGRFADGTARRFVLAPAVEHIGVLYSATALAEARDWLNQAFGLRGVRPPDSRGAWLGLLFLGILLLARPASRLLPRVAPRPQGAGLRWTQLLPAAVAPAILTPLLLRALPTHWLPLLLGDYLAAHFALYGLLSAGCLALLRPRKPAVSGSPFRLAGAALAVAAYGIAAVGIPLDRYAASFLPTAGRLPLAAAMLAGLLPFFLVDEWLTRGPGAAPGGYAATKLALALSLALAVALDPARLFFLAIIVPVILVFFVVYGLFSRWAYRRTNQPLVGALGNAAAFAWAIAVTFPVVG